MNKKYLQECLALGFTGEQATSALEAFDNDIGLTMEYLRSTYDIEHLQKTVCYLSGNVKFLNILDAKCFILLLLYMNVLWKVIQ